MTDRYSHLYSLEIVGKKARVINPFGSVFGMREKSRLNKLINIGQGTYDRYFALIVEGKMVYFKIPFNDVQLFT